MKNFKRILSLILTTSLVLSASGCNFASVGRNQSDIKNESDSVGGDSAENAENVHYDNIAELKVDGREYGNVEEITYYSASLGRDRLADVYLPHDYDSSKRYNVIYLLHGMGGNYNEYNRLNIQTIAENTAYDNNLDSVIMVSMNVFCDPADKQESDYAFSVLAGLYDNCVDDIIGSLMPYVNSHYSTATGREHTAVCGYSLGGREALYLTYSHPESFGYVGAFSPVGGVVDTGSNNYTGNGRALLSTLDLSPAYAQPSVIVLAVGTEDPYCLKSTEQYHSYMEKSGIAHTYYTMSGGHEVKVWDDGFITFYKMIF